MKTKELISRLGGSSEVARLCEVTVGAVSQWKASGAVPKARLMYLRAVRPEVFKEPDPPELAEKEPDPRAEVGQ